MTDLTLDCGHCGHRGPVQHRENVLVKEDIEHAEGFGEIHWQHFVGVYQCVACDEVTISEAYWADEIGDAFAEKKLFPTVRDNSAVPERVRNRLDAALKVKKGEPTFLRSSTTSRQKTGFPPYSRRSLISCASLATSRPMMMRLTLLLRMCR